MFSVIDKKNCRSVYRISVKGDVEFEYLLKETDEGYDQVVDSYKMNEMEFFEKEEGGIVHSIFLDVSTTKERSNVCLHS